MRGNSHARCGVGENSEITSKNYLSLYKIDAGGDNRCEYQNTYHHNDQPDKRDLAFCHTIHLTGDSANHTKATPYNGAAELP